MADIIKNAKDLDNIKIDAKKIFNESKEKILVCTGGGCIACGALEIVDSLEKAIKKNSLESKVTVVKTGCLGPCAKGPVVLTEKGRVFYKMVKPADALDIIEKHIIGGDIVERLVQKVGVNKTPVPLEQDIEFFKRQTKIVLRNSGIIDPCSINDYIAQDGYAGLEKVLNHMTTEDVVNEMKNSGLRGRGGAGFPTGLKWSFAAGNSADQKYILCNGDEGDPGAFMDRSVLEGDPHSLIEGMAIGGYAIGATMGYVYVRAEYPLAVERLQKAIDDAKEVGLLGKNIFGSSFSFDLEIRMGSGAFVCGEETALIASIEGKRGEPRPRPPFPAVSGLWKKPTVLNNVETYASVAQIMLKGAKWFASFGTEKSKGTKVFALTGAIKNAGLVEVPIGTTLGELIFDIGGGIPNKKKFKSAQIGGPSGGCVLPEHLNVPLDYESLNELGAIMGSGGLVVMDEDTCMVDVARFFLEFVQEESCGKCVPCRVGTKRMLEILDRICSGNGKMEDIDTLETMGKHIQETALCGLGQTAPNPVLSTIQNFRHEYESHIIQKHCEAGICPDLVRAPCQSACPANVDIPGFVSLVGEKRYAEGLILHRERNPFVAVCARVCFHPCESKCRRETLDSAVSVRGVKRFMADQEITIQLPEIKENITNAGKMVAIIGAGPAGLTCAYFLARLGYKPKIFESSSRPGGMLVQTIPAYRLPREIIAREVRMIEQLGVDIETNKTLGKDFSVEDLKKQGYEALFLAVGAPDGTKLHIPGCDADGAIDAISFLREYNTAGSVAIGKKVVIVGGGNAAIDAARTAIRLGATETTLIYRRSAEEMTAYIEEINAAKEEGLIIKTLTNPEEITVVDGKVAGIKCQIMVLGEFDSSGRRRPVDSTEDLIIETDQVIFAVGQSLDCESLIKDSGIHTIQGSKIRADQTTGQTSVPWIFSGGDASTGADSVVSAIGAGERAAVGMDQYLNGKKDAFWRKEKINDTAFDPDEDPSEIGRKSVSEIEVERRINNFEEVEMCWNEKDALKQAKRCLRCDYGKCVI